MQQISKKTMYKYLSVSIDLHEPPTPQFSLFRKAAEAGIDH